MQILRVIYIYKIYICRHGYRVVGYWNRVTDDPALYVSWTVFDYFSFLRWYICSWIFVVIMLTLALMVRTVNARHPGPRRSRIKQKRHFLHMCSEPQIAKILIITLVNHIWLVLKLIQPPPMLPSINFVSLLIPEWYIYALEHFVIRLLRCLGPEHPPMLINSPLMLSSIETDFDDLACIVIFLLECFLVSYLGY